LIINDRTTRDQLSTIRTKHLRAYLIHSKIISINRLEFLIEKQDLIHLIESNKQRIPDRTYVLVGQSDRETVDIIDEEEQVRYVKIVNYKSLIGILVFLSEGQIH
jgi:hypothetical protein